MKVMYGLGKARASKPTSIAIGIFDGVHRGHQHLIALMLKKAVALKAVGTVVTFFPHPAHVLRPDHQLPYLMPLSERLAILQTLGVEQVVVVKFDRRFAMMGPEQFIEKLLVQRLKAKAILVGEDFKFGQDRRGNIFLFEELSRQLGYHFFPVPAVRCEGQVISSTRVRGLVAQGDLARAKRLLGRSFSVTGKVVKGDGRGKRIGFPTANIAYESDVVPPKGVYAVQAVLGDTIYPAVANLGIRPTFKSTHEGLHLEVHILAKINNIYGQTLRVVFLKKIRDEKVFPSSQELIKQITRDIRAALRLV